MYEGNLFYSLTLLMWFLNPFEFVTPVLEEYLGLRMSRAPWMCATPGGSHWLFRLQGRKWSGKNPVPFQELSPPRIRPSHGLEALQSGQSPFNIPELRYK